MLESALRKGRALVGRTFLSAQRGARFRADRNVRPTSTPSGQAPSRTASKPRVSALVLALNEAENLPGCLEALGWADERIVVVDPASTDETEAIARRQAEVVLV